MIGRLLLRSASHAAALVCAVLCCRCLTAQQGLRIVYGRHGIQTLSYRGVVLEDLAQFPEDAFHIWHMKSADRAGRPLRDGQFGWGENNSGKQWDAATHTYTYRFTWGSIEVHFAQAGDTLNMSVTERNNPASGISFDGATICPFVLHFPQQPIGFGGADSTQLAFNTTGPSVVTADFGAGQVTATVTEAAKPLYSGWVATDRPATYVPILSSTAPDFLPAFQQHHDRPIAPGGTDQFTVSLRFAPAGADVNALVGDVYAAWAARWPPQLHWSDRRIIGTIFLASSSGGDPHHPAGFSNNPRRYFSNGEANTFDVRSAAGLARFQRRVLQQARDAVINLQRLHAQGAVTWDLEGEEYPMDTSYVCAPDQIATVAPEMESIVTDRASRYAGMKLDDAYFLILRSAGFRVGVCVRPQRFVRHGDAAAEQVTLGSDAEVTEELLRKLRYAHDRWGATLFYIDSAVDSRGAPLNSDILQRVAAALPDSLLIPEESVAKDYAYTAPFRTFLFHGDLGTDSAVYHYYPHAFSVNLINDVDASKLAAHRADLTAAVRRGDVLMAHAAYWQTNNDAILQIYKDAGRSLSAPTRLAPR